MPYNDEQTPKNLTGVKMLPIFEFDDGPINESLDIIKRLDSKNILNFQEVIATQLKELEILCDRVGKDIHNLAMPYWIWTPEFNNESREYFETKKSKKRGPFKELVIKKDEFTNSLNKTLKEIETYLNPYFNGDKIDLSDIIIASHLWGMYVVPEFQFSQKMHHYLQQVAKACQFNYHQDFWK